MSQRYSSIIDLNLALPLGSANEEKLAFEITFFDKNGDGIDDRMNISYQTGRM